MPPRPAKPSTRRHVHIYDEDWEFLERNFGKTEGNGMGVAVVVRALVSQKVRAMRAAAQARADEAAREAE